MKLIEEIKEKLIDKVNMYSDNRIEIRWNFKIDLLNHNQLLYQNRKMTQLQKFCLGQNGI